jgi:hypothetical protein
MSDHLRRSRMGLVVQIDGGDRAQRRRPLRFYPESAAVARWWEILGGWLLNARGG